MPLLRLGPEAIYPNTQRMRVTILFTYQAKNARRLSPKKFGHRDRLISMAGAYFTSGHRSRNQPGAQRMTARELIGGQTPISSRRHQHVHR